MAKLLDAGAPIFLPLAREAITHNQNYKRTTVLNYIGNNGDQTDIKILLDFLGSQKNSERIAAYKDLNNIIARTFDKHMQKAIAECMGELKIETVPYSDKAKSVGLVLDIVLFIGMVSHTLNKGKEEIPPLSENSISQLKEMFGKII